MTNEERMNAVEEAIIAIEQGAQSYTIGTRSVTRANLKTLYDERKSLKQELLNDENNGGTYVAQFSGM